MALPIDLDDHGLTLPGSMAGSYDMYFDDQYVWSFTPDRRHPSGDGRYLVPWPTAMKHWLDGSARVVIREGGDAVYDAEVRLGSGEGRIRFVDPQGIPVMIDKWGLLQRPFSGRGAGVVEQMIDTTEQIIDILARDVGVHCWLAFGSLLGAAREGKVIGHDSDVDLAYLSHQATPAALNREMFGITRALRRHGLRVLNKSGSFVTVLFDAPDGGVGSIDIYTCFYLSGQLHETATIRQPVPREAIEPLGTLEFEGRELPVPADPDAMLEVSYGPNWRVPDPSFQHQPPRSVTDRFDGWFGNLMPNRREWERWVRLNRDNAGDGPTPFGEWALAALPARDPVVIDLGAGYGRDAVAAARLGARVYACDYARGAWVVARQIAQEEELRIGFTAVNLFSYRSCVTRAAELAYDKGSRTVLLGNVLDCVGPEERRHAYAMLRLLLARGHGGTAYLEFAHDLGSWQWEPNTGGQRHEVPVVEVRTALERLGGQVVELTALPPSPETEGMGRTRMAVRWPKADWSGTAPPEEMRSR